MSVIHRIALTFAGTAGAGAAAALDTSGSPAGSGALFGLAVAPHAAGVYYVDDATNTLNMLH